MIKKLVFKSGYVEVWSEEEYQKLITNKDEYEKETKDACFLNSYSEVQCYKRELEEENNDD